MKTAMDLIDRKGRDMVSVPEETTIHQALREMNRRRVGAVLVTRDGQVVGIWTERDLLRDSLGAGFDPTRARIEDHMTTDLVSVDHAEDLYTLMDKFLGLRIRHLLVTRDDAYVGIVSSGDVMKAVIQEKDAELKRLDAIVNWEYYENWKWKP